MYFFCQVLYAYPQGSGTYRALLTVSDFFFFFFPWCLSLPIAKLMCWRESWQGHWTQYHWGHKGQGMDGGTWWWNSISKQRPESRLHMTERTPQTPCESRSRCFLFLLHSLAPPPSASSPGRRQPRAGRGRATQSSILTESPSFGVAYSAQALILGISAFFHSVLYFLIFDFYGFSFTSLIRERQHDGIAQSFNID